MKPNTSNILARVEIVAGLPPGFLSLRDAPRLSDEQERALANAMRAAADLACGHEPEDACDTNAPAGEVK